ncbi:TetR family transcriptional regulator [Actinomycetes bacterium M1A6_2h]
MATDRTAPRRDRRQALIDATIELIAEGADADISAAAISRRAGVAHGLLFYYFTDKQGLVGAALADILGRLAEHQGPRPDESSPRARLEGFVRRHVEFVGSYRDAYSRFAREGVLGHPEVADAIGEARARGARQVARLAGVEEPLDTVMSAAVRGWVGFLDRTADEYFDDPDFEMDQLVALAVDTLLAVIDSARRLS